MNLSSFSSWMHRCNTVSRESSTSFYQNERETLRLRMLNESISVRLASNVRKWKAKEKEAREKKKKRKKRRGVLSESYIAIHCVKLSFRCSARARTRIYRGTRCYVTVDRMRIMWAASFIRKVNNYTFPFVSQVGRQVYEVDGN